MATKKQKRAAGIAKREAFEREERERNQAQLRAAQEGRRLEREAAEKQRKDRAVTKSRKMAKEHAARKNREAQGIKEYHAPSRPSLSTLIMLASLAQPLNEHEDLIQDSTV